MKKEFHLLIDDVRTFQMDCIARTIEQGEDCLAGFPVTHLYIDHDLGEEESGYDLIKWAIKEGLCPHNVQIVSMNPVGRDNIANALHSAGYLKRGCWYRLGDKRWKQEMLLSNPLS